MFHCCMRIFRDPKAYVVMVHLTTHTKRHLITENQLLSKLSSSSRWWKSTQKWKQKLWSWGFSTCNSCSWYPLALRRLRRICQTLDWGICNSWLTQCIDFWGLLTNISRTRSTVSADGPSRPVLFTAHRQPLCWNFKYHSRILLSVGGSVRYMVQNLCCAITIDSVLANFKTQNTFLFPVQAMFRHNCPLVVKLASMPRRLVYKKSWRDSLPIDILLSAVSVLVVAQPILEVLEGLMNYPVYALWVMFSNPTGCWIVSPAIFLHCSLILQYHVYM